ncbi:hypothetical protein EVAR_40060_1 [Eumeta japonica]|uniref:Uncharacterized protein n=1 Tax=Eumeta variegata TaxID=151549 RepID=A0A4C1WBY2_EUMVA|nr:hypothetical protein EVAR_40060_1 [Eumeta japonica]
MNKLRVTQRVIEKARCSESQLDKIQNEAIHRSSRVTDISHGIKKMKSQWATHIARRSVIHQRRKVLKDKPQTERRVTRPRSQPGDYFQITLSFSGDLWPLAVG